MKKIKKFVLENSFSRRNERDDAIFYKTPEYESFLSLQSRNFLTDYYDEVLPHKGKVLDLMAGVHSHIPTSRQYQEIVGLGLNETELRANSQLTDVTVQDLNKRPSLPYCDAYFDACLLSSGVQYLVNPVAVIREIGRVLKDKGYFVISFSTNMFPKKAVINWRKSSVAERIKLLESYLRYSGNFYTPSHRELSDEGMHSFYIVTAQKKDEINAAVQTTLRLEYISRRLFFSLVGGGLLAFTCGIKSASAQDVKSRVIKIVVEQLGVREEDVKLGSNFVEDLGADSLDTVELVMALEEEFEIEILDEDAERIVTVEKAISYIKKHIK